MFHLILGMSHTTALFQALKANPVAGTEVINLRNRKDIMDRSVEQLNLENYDGPVPDVISLSIGGNAHATTSLVEHPNPYSVGCIDGAGQVPNDPTRHFIPADLLRDFMARRFEKAVGPYIAQIHAFWPSARIFHLCAPPPSKDVDLDSANSPAFKELATLGAAPADMRLAVWRLQTELYDSLASKQGAEFMRPPSIALDPDGFLLPEFSSGDPTHANKLYGALVIEALDAKLKEPA